MPANPASDLLLITSASGNQASALLPRLSSWKNLRLAVNSDASKQRLEKAYPHADVVKTDLYSPTNTTALLKDVNVVIHIGPPFHPHETGIGYMMIDAANAAYDGGKGSLKHIILSSVICTQLRKMMNHDGKRYIEEAIMESGLPYTILQPTTFMDNLPLPLFMEEEKPKFPASWNTDVRFSWICLHDLSEVYAKVLEQREKHFFAQYPLVSTHGTVSFAEALKIVGDKLGKKIDFEVSEYRTGVDNLLKRISNGADVDPRIRDAAQRMVLFYDNRGIVGNSNVLEWVLGREATQFEEWVELKMEQVKRGA